MTKFFKIQNVVSQIFFTTRKQQKTAKILIFRRFMWDCLMVAEGRILVLFSKGVVKATDEESGCLVKLVNVETLVYAV